MSLLTDKSAKAQKGQVASSGGRRPSFLHFIILPLKRGEKASPEKKKKKNSNTKGGLCSKHPLQKWVPEEGMITSDSKWGVAQVVLLLKRVWKNLG